MTDGLDGHIGDEALTKLIEQSTSSVSEVCKTHPHLSSCAVCRVQFETRALLQSRLDISQLDAAPATDCEPHWLGFRLTCRQVAAGVRLTERSLSFVNHAKECHDCGAILLDVLNHLAEFNKNIRESEPIYTASLRGGSAEWNRHLTQHFIQMFKSTHTAARHNWWTTPRLVTAGACILVLFAAGLILTRRNPRVSVGNVLSHTYSRNRTLELRIAGARYAPRLVGYGQQEEDSRSTLSSYTQDQDLHEAQQIIGHELANHPSDPSWMQAAGQAAILESKYNESIAVLRRAVQLAPSTPSLLSDLATALFQRGDKQKREEDFGAAFEHLSQALQITPNDPTALFNRAVVAERLFLFHQALNDWEEYLQVDGDSQWAEEARNRANKVREKLREHDNKADPLLAPNQVAALAATGTSDSDIDRRLEEYLPEAVRTWLPKAFALQQPVFTNNGNIDRNDQNNALQALSVLAALSKQNHGDHWISDLLDGSSALNFAKATESLARATRYYQTGDYRASRQEAVKAEKSFRISGNVAGALYAEFFQTLDDQLSGDNENCLRASILAEVEAGHHEYLWLQGQLQLQEGVCAGIIGDLGAYERASERAQALANKAKYRDMYLRAVGFLGDSKFAIGNRSSGLNVINAGLNRYWSSRSFSLYAYNLYSFEADGTEGAGEPNLLLAMRREAQAKIDDIPDPVQRAEGHSLLASAALAAGQPAVADHEYQEAVRLYMMAPQSAATRIERYISEVRAAQVEARQGTMDRALTRLNTIQGEVQQLSNNYLAELFYAAQGEAELRSYHLTEAERAFRSALPLTERNLKSLHSEADRSTWAKDAGPVYLGLVETALLQGKEEESLNLFEWYLDASQRVSTSASSAIRSAPDPTHISSRLPLLANQTIVSYAILPDGLAIWTYDDRGVSARWIAQSSQELQNLARTFFEECSDHESDLSALRRDGQALYSMLVAPVEARLDSNRTLVVETDPSLARLPFEALVDGRGHYLIERGPIVHSHGLYAQDRMHPAAPISSVSRTVVVGSTTSIPERGFPPIPDLQASTHAVARLFNSVRTIEGIDATFPAIGNALPGAVVFHFAGHAITAPDHTGLLLEGVDTQTGGPAVLSVNSVRHLPLKNMQLAVLAACSTDSGEGTARGVGSVAAAFESAGVPHVVATRWRVDLAQPLFLGYFYQSLLSGDTTSGAVRFSSRKMLLNPETAHPYYWAAFGAYGRP